MFQIRFVWKNLKGRRIFFIIGILLSAIASIPVFVNPYLTKVLVDDVIKGGKKDWLIPILLIMCGVVLSVSVIRFFRVLFLEWASQFMLLRIRKHLFTNLQYQEMRFFDRNRSGDIITRITGDLDLVRHICAWTVYQFTDSVVMFAASVIFLFSLSIPLTLSLLAVLPFLAIAIRVFMKKVRPLYQQLRFKLSELNTAAQENIAGNRVVKAFAREEYEKEKFDRKSLEFKEASLKAVYTNQKIQPFMEFIGQSMTIITVLVGGLFVINGSISIGTLFAFSGLTWALAQPIRTLSTLLNDVQRFSASADKIIELYYARPTIVDRHDAVDTTDRIRGKVEFKNVSFRFDNLQVLSDISFVAEPGETVAIMGPTGSGKTTLIALLARFYDVQHGEVTIDDVDVRKWRVSKVRSSVAISTQDVFLYSDTVDGNIAYGNPELSEEKVIEYAKSACAHGFINKMEDGYNTVIGERGVGLSGGQRQRIALARALAVEPPILILDDTTSAVDMETESYIQNELRSLKFPCTKFIIAQRISSVKDADKIIILDKGTIQIGTHETLAATNKFYREICELQDVPELPVYKGGN
ncbi:MAG: hypothetical protein BGN88_03940 [Clostridiales bacterium 43-6]|nr:MAG: hypothetical protein BGN88_03940 [Clostridiales bacterium 43-6]